MSVERSMNSELIKAIATHPSVYPFISDDFSPSPEQWQPVINEDSLYLVFRDGETALGMFALFPENRVCWKVHTCFLPVGYGESAKQAAQICQQWMWENTPCVRIVTDVPEYNAIAHRFARAAGLTEYGRNPRSYLKNGKLWDVILLGISREN